jgi:hypothetical protein
MFLIDCSPGVVEGDRELRTDLITHSLRDTHATGFGEALEPRGDIDTVAIDTRVLGQHLAQVHADAEHQAALARKRCVAH